MTIIDEILTIANELANEGKQPSVALVKTKLTSTVPLPTIIKTLKNWQHDPEFKVEKTAPLTEATTPNAAITDTEQKIAQALQPVLNELVEIKQLLKQLVEKHNQQQ